MIKPSLSIVVEGKLAGSLTDKNLRSIEQAVQTNTLFKGEHTVGLKFVNQSESRKLNKQYANNDYATDVLSFEYSSDRGDSMGDIVICTPIAAQQAKENGISLNAELTLLIVHGVLHLLKYDHQTDQDTASMDWLQSAIMKSLNYQYRDFKWSH